MEIDPLREADRALNRWMASAKNEIEMSNTNGEDDGSLAFLNIAPDETNKHFNCPETTQQQLINRSFWLCDFITGQRTKYGEDRYIVLVKFNKDDNMADARKFFTNSREIKYVLDEIKKRKGLPATCNDARQRHPLLHRVTPRYKAVSPGASSLAGMRITARMPASPMRIRITLPRIRMRTSAPGITDITRSASYRPG